jgi:undecaprenyl diphosphate synthase
MTVVIAVSYGAREEIATAARAIARRVKRGELSADRITPTVVADHLSTAGIPDPDVLIRTGGEMRLSNFLLWQLAYTEIFVTPTLWPDFGEPEFLRTLGVFQERQRRFGRTPDQVERESIRAAY